ncbi:MAG: PD40 domain-containing protein [Candidatus Eiseniibacteriota bacterium]|nr:MAG: PD40 domain-containing protein [Candidatus Eisenbacteria bacterium]
MKVGNRPSDPASIEATESYAARTAAHHKRLFLAVTAALMLFLMTGCSTDEKSTPPQNRPPSINGIALEPPRAAPGDTLTATAIAGDPEGGPVYFLWRASRGTLVDSTSESVRWVAPDSPFTCSLTVYVNDEVTEVSMTRLIPVGAGYLRIESFPEGASVMIDSEPTALTTPLEVVNAPAGSYLISVQRAPYSYSPSSSSVEVTHGETTRVRFRLNDGAMAMTPITVSDCVSQSSWSPDGSRIVCAVEDSALSYFTFAIFDSPWPDAFGDVVATYGQPNWAPCWCPTGCEFLFASSRFAGTSMIFKVAISGFPYQGTPQLLYGSPSNYPVWSPDASTVAFVAGSGGSFSLNVMPAGGGSPTVLVTDVVEDRPSWSPDGTQIVFSKIVGDKPRLFSVSSTGGTPVQLSEASALHPSWSPDGSKIAFVSSEYAGDNIWILFLDETPSPVLGHLTGNGANWPAWRPDGTGLCYTMYNPLEDCFTLWLAEGFPF